jgi:hypothetical protein
MAQGTIRKTAWEAYDWFPRVAAELESLEAGSLTWRSSAAMRLRLLVGQRLRLTPEDREMLALVALELVGEEDQLALERGLATWRTLAADELADAADATRSRSLTATPSAVLLK